MVLELVVIGRRRHWGGTRTLVWIHLKEVIWLILNENQIMFLCYCIYGLATLSPLCSISWIMTRAVFFIFYVNRVSHRERCNLRHKVNQKWFAGTSTLLIPIGENIVQVLRDQSLFIKFHWAHLDSHWQNSLDNTGECKFLCNQVVTTFKEHSGHYLQGGCATDRGYALPILIRWIMVNISRQLYIKANGFS